ncbi:MULTISPECIES: STAS domain-containing protein [Protofrankia]|nr:MULTISPECIES: STAS domain-containing protein [Protofrankia]
MEGFLHLSGPLSQRTSRSVIRFHTDTYAPPSMTIVRVHGEIDMATGAAFRAALMAGLDQLPPLLVVDLDGVSFLDACGLGILVGVANRAALAGIPVKVVGVRPHIYRLFALTRMVDRLNVHATPTAAALIPDLAPPGAATAPTALTAV